MIRRTFALLAVVSLMSATRALAHPDCGGYCSYAQIGTFLQSVADAHPDITRLYTMGYSEEGRNLWAIQITDNPDVEEDEPEFRYISTMHGDEWVGNEMCLYFVEYLTDNYGSNPDVTDLVNEIDIWIMPLMNPDGYVRTRRENVNWVDLNRDFPCPYTSPNNTPEGRAAETAVIMNWSFGTSFTLSANMHTGALVVNYPYDANASGSYVYTPTPDDDLFVYISEEYSQHNVPMWNSSYFYHGITNGADWYVIYGGMQDWNYVYMGCNEVTLELSNTKIPSASQIPTYWGQNRDSMLAYMATCLIGVRGIVTDAGTGEPLAATVTVAGRDHEIYTDPDVGDYHRMLLPGTYDLTFEADGYDPMTISGVVIASGDATRLDVALNPPMHVVYPNGGETLTAGIPVDVVWTGGAEAQFQVQYTDNYEEIGLRSDDFERDELGPNYESSEDADWFITTSDQHGGIRAARAGEVGDNQKSSMECSCEGGPLGFWYRVSSEENYDWFEFYIDDEMEFRDSGEGTWQHYSTTLPPGPHVVKWRYRKDRSASEGADTVFIDDVELVGDVTAWHDIVALTDPGATSAEWTPTGTSTACKVRVRSSYDGGASFGFWDESDGTFTIEPSGLVGDLDNDGDVDLGDLGILLAAYGSCAGDPNYSEVADIDNSGCVDLADLGLLLAHYGESLL